MRQFWSGEQISVDVVLRNKKLGRPVGECTTFKLMGREKWFDGLRLKITDITGMREETKTSSSVDLKKYGEVKAIEAVSIAGKPAGYYLEPGKVIVNRDKIDFREVMGEPFPDHVYKIEVEMAPDFIEGINPRNISKNVSFSCAYVYYREPKSKREEAIKMFHLMSKENNKRRERKWREMREKRILIKDDVKGMGKKWEEMYKKAIELDSTLQFPYRALSRMYRRQKRYSDEEIILMKWKEVARRGWLETINGRLDELKRNR
ncbi:MAG: hypothetical protein JXR96_22670 [Deltaproteobacteria bacterium]|nr:hypothetical protein [Deltaproteobacteria bacterium]